MSQLSELLGIMQLGNFTPKPTDQKLGIEGLRQLGANNRTRQEVTGRRTIADRNLGIQSGLSPELDDAALDVVAKRLQESAASKSLNERASVARKLAEIGRGPIWEAGETAKSILSPQTKYEPMPLLGVSTAAAGRNEQSTGTSNSENLINGQPISGAPSKRVTTSGNKQVNKTGTFDTPAMLAARQAKMITYVQSLPAAKGRRVIAVRPTTVPGTSMVTFADGESIHIKYNGQ